jgi:hypothetical protein
MKMTKYQQTIILQTIVYFFICKLRGLNRLEAIQSFLKTHLSLRYKTITVQFIYDVAFLVGY